jgi:hypothetical protein
MSQKDHTSISGNAKPASVLRKPPSFCQYEDSACEQDFVGIKASQGIFLYPSDPPQIAATIEGAVAQMRKWNPQHHRRTWKEFQTTGQVIFCSICKSMRFSDHIIADVTTLNFNLLFEIGFALGLGLPVIPIRDTTFVRDKLVFDELGMLDTIGYLDFQNSNGLAVALVSKFPVTALPAPHHHIDLESPLYVLKGHIDTEGAVRLMSVLKKSALRFRSFDALETPRLSLQEARKQVDSSLGVIAHLLSADRIGALVHNARCALVAGLALAAGKSVLLLQEGLTRQPIDYRDVVTSYTHPDQVPRLLEGVLSHVVSQLQDARIRAVRRPERLLEQVDLGDVAAENEIRALRSYFVRTAQFHEAKRGNARLVIGRKGSGKTAIFYAVRDSLINRRSFLVLDLKPEGHQFSKLREVVLSKLSEGFQEHTLTAFWNYILLCELACKALKVDHTWALRDETHRQAFGRLAAAYEKHASADAGDFSERLLREVERIASRYPGEGAGLSANQLTQTLFRDDIRELDDTVADYLESKDEIWLLIDNLDKGWPTRGAKKEDILILRTLLEATRKLQRQLEHRETGFRCLVFLRNDIYEHLLIDTPDKGKDTAIVLDYDDREFFKELIVQRIKSSTGLTGSFENIWAAVFDTHLGTEDAFQYIIDRTLMRPRDLLNFLHRAIEVAINRGHERVSGDDILKAEETFSEDILLSIAFEIRDVYPTVSEPLYEFLGCPAAMPVEDATSKLESAGFAKDRLDEAIDLLLWFGFFGVQEGEIEKPTYAYQMRHNLAKLVAPLKHKKGVLVVHPAFRKALQCGGLTNGGR